MTSIQFFTFAPVVQRNNRLDSDLASARYRVIIPAMRLARRGHKINIGTISADPHVEINPTSVASDVVVFSKSINPNNEKLAVALRSRNVMVVVDLCDNYFDHAGHGKKFRDHTIAMCRLADRIVTSTQKLAEIVHEHTGTDATIIGDPVEGTRESVAFNPQPSQLKLLWFGHQGNWPSLAACIPSLANMATGHRIELEVVTNPLPAIVQQLQAIHHQYSGRLSIKLTPWSRDATWTALARSDLVIIPSLESDFHAAKSPNRLTESLWAGRMVVAHPIDSYQEYASFAILDKNIVAGVQRALATHEEIPARIRAGQVHMGTTNSPYIIGQAWERALGLADPSWPVRLHMSCDGTLAKDSVNIDMTYAGLLKNPDLISEGGSLPMFHDNTADEVISSAQILTHDGSFNVSSLLKEWYRVVKPAGQLTLRCTDNQSADDATIMMRNAGFSETRKEAAPGSIRAIGIKKNDQ